MKLHYKKIGSGKPLIILHGLFGSLDNWQSIGNKFGVSGFEVYLVDQRNHGRSPHSDEWNYDLMAGDINELLLENNLSSVNIIGHSMGGKTALTFANNYPEKINKLIVVDIAPRYYPIHHTAVIEALKAVDFGKVFSRKEVEEILKEKIQGDIATQQFLLKNLYWTDDESKKMAWRFNLNVISRDIENVGKEVECVRISGPTLFIKGGLSQYITLADEVNIKRTIKNATIQEIKNAGHWVHASNPDEFFSTALNYLL